jgi:hypothetical protein
MPNSENIINVRGKRTDTVIYELEQRLDNFSETQSIWLVDSHEPKLFYNELKRRNLFFQLFIIDENEYRLLICKY